MDAMITAGGTLKPDDPLFQQFGIEKKALLPMVGRPMISWVLEALRNSGGVDHIAIVGLDPDELDYQDDRLHFTPSTGNLVDNVVNRLYSGFRKEVYNCIIQLLRGIIRVEVIVNIPVNK